MKEESTNRGETIVPGGGFASLLNAVRRFTQIVAYTILPSVAYCTALKDAYVAMSQASLIGPPCHYVARTDMMVRGWN